MNDLPQGWLTAPLGEISSCQLGKMLSAKAKRGQNPLPYLRNINVRWGSFDLRDLATMDFTEREVAKYELHAGDVLVCEGGEPGRAAVWRGQHPGLLYQKALHRVRLAPGLQPEFIAHQLRHLAYSGAFARDMSGSTILHLPQEDLEALQFRVAPTKEQRRIVDALDVLLSRVEAGVEQLGKNAAQLAAYRAAVLRAACEGRLVPTEAELARAEGRTADAAPAPHPSRLKIGANVRLQELPPVDHFAPAEGWGAAELDQLVTRDSTIVYGILQAGPHQPDGVPYVRPTEMDRGHIDRESILRTTPEIASRYARSALAKSDVILSIVGTIGEVAIVPAWLEGGNLNQSAVRIRVDRTLVLPEYVALALQSPILTEQYDLLQFGTAVRRLNVIDVRRLRMPLPPLKEQHRIVAEVERRLSVVERLEAAIDASLARAKRLRQAILKRAFEGRLVPQDPSDEPASVLLERILKEKGTRGAAARGATRPVRKARRS